MSRQGTQETLAVAQSPPILARWAVSTIFFINGVVLASWVPHIPAVKTQHALSDGQLGLVLLSMSMGSVLTLPLAGWLVGRFGSRGMTTLAILAFCLVLPLPLLSPNVFLLCLSLGLFGASNSTLDVSMNAQAVAVERCYQRAIMSSFHGLFSLGGLVGAGLAGWAMSVGVGAEEHVVTATIVSLVTVIVALMVLRLLPSELQQGETGPAFATPTKALLGLGGLAFLGLLAEGSMADWSAVYLQHVLNTSSALASAGFAVFSLMMAVGRFSGDALVNRFGPSLLLRGSSLVAAIGLGLGVFIGEPLAAVVGFGLVGLGIANIIPVLFSAAGHVRGVPPGVALAAVASTGYCGLLAGPPLIGFVAEVTNLSAGLGLVSACCTLIAVSAGGVLRPLGDPSAVPNGEAVIE